MYRNAITGDTIKIKKQIIRVSILQSAKVAAALYLVISIPLCLLMLIPIVLAGGAIPGYSVGTVIAMPVFYTVFGFLFTLIGAWVYNLIASQLGGFEYTTAEIAGD